MRENCVYCKIASGKEPCFKVYEDGKFMAFLDIRPLNPGHCLVIPKKHYRWTYDVENYGEYLEMAKKIGLAIIDALGANNFSVVTLGHAVPHAHVWVVPRFENDGHGNFLDWHNIKKLSEREMLEIAEKIKKHIK